VPLSAVTLRLADEVGQAVLDRIAAGDLAAAAELDQHVAAVRAEPALGRPDQSAAARRAGQNAAQAGWPRPARPYHAQRLVAAWSTVSAPRLRSTEIVAAACPDVPFADNPWQTDAPLVIRLLLHYACGFTEAAVQADWWPANPAVGYEIEWQALRLAAVCRLVRQAETAAAVHPDLD
jgi:hypothetical protein